MKQQEADERELVLQSGVEVIEDGSKADIPKCSICFFDCFLSFVTCGCSSNKAVCLRHHDRLSCLCRAATLTPTTAPQPKRLHTRVALSDIQSLIEKHYSY